MAALHGLLVSPQRMCSGASTSRSACKASPVAQKPVSPHRFAHERNCAVASCSSRCDASIDELSKYERILRFVEDTQVQPVAQITQAVATGDFGEQRLGEADSSWCHSFGEQRLGEADSSWCHSYDEEAEEGCSDSEEQQDAYLMHASSSAGSSGSAAAGAGAGSSNSVYASAYYRARLSSMEAQFAQVAAARRPFHLSADEDASEAAVWVVARANNAAQQQQAARTERRSRSLRRARRAARIAATAAAAAPASRCALRADYGPLERCEPWVDPAATAAAAAATASPSGRYGAVLAHKLASVKRHAVKPLAGGIEEVLVRLRAADRKLGEFRAPQAWHLTFDEDVHGSYDEASVMASC